jgi:hypothetical protein
MDASNVVRIIIRILSRSRESIMQHQILLVDANASRSLIGCISECEFSVLSDANHQVYDSLRTAKGSRSKACLSLAPSSANSFGSESLAIANSHTVYAPA